jgi:predicted RNA binding protein YcfA (HicA-like mRNA interferase family)
MKYSEFIREIESRGAALHRTGGKHIIYRHPRLERNLVFTKAKTVSSGVYRQCDKLLASVGA